MSKFLLAVLSVALLAGASRADEMPVKPPAEKYGTVMLAVMPYSVEVAARVRGRVIASRIQSGMTEEQVVEVIGNRKRTATAVQDTPKLFYADIGLSVYLRYEDNAANDLIAFVDRVSFAPIFPTPAPTAVVAPPRRCLLPRLRTPVAGE